ncbi:MAG: electron transfer flavoprotein beta subunit/FixA family protein [Propionibacteriaceae bacterium]|jgi:electron transfer flavoprotein beta subunit|nr:electron transfer flavoprotein beta subunit/FixA family protein [Propionibacteriaceae bacterium]
MRIAVAHKWAADPQEAVVTASGQVDQSRARPSLSEYDAVAIALARGLADAVGAELVGLSVGGPEAASPLATKTALARGLDSVLVLADQALASADSTTTARALAAAVTELGDVAVVLTGDCSVDRGARMTPAVLGGLLGWVTLTEVSAVSLDQTSLTVERELEHGRQTLVLSAPAVLAVAAGAVEAPAPGMRDVLAAARKPVRQLALDQFDGDWGPLGQVVDRALAPTPDRRGIVIGTTDPTAAAAELIAHLSRDGLTWAGRP